ncbi:uncharacterized protein CTRU02_203143 [Colletotrichum truncatum]|uniref:Uncharacterized protein n=1 Tax=Colletotrichum truncatum TaxID=5467 RepID=A0ACC3Z8P9_COLTU|nr:uncharacterized protein CTRU02_08983 [Colletotrichum truncatum]KAF6789191.1 hypothetical protein CTRU02_08983 [Colletotrichum truncatum]
MRANRGSSESPVKNRTSFGSLGRGGGRVKHGEILLAPPSVRVNTEAGKNRQRHVKDIGIEAPNSLQGIASRQDSKSEHTLDNDSVLKSRKRPMAISVYERLSLTLESRKNSARLPDACLPGLRKQRARQCQTMGVTRLTLTMMIRKALLSKSAKLSENNDWYYV